MRRAAGAGVEAGGGGTAAVSATAVTAPGRVTR
jgi:hypothetical protein